jgi:hypothetical protein
VARRRLTVRRIDPWSVLKFGAVANLALLVIGLLVVGVVFFIIDRLGLIDQVCSIVLEVGFQACGINAGNLFRAIALLGLLGVVIQTAVLVFLSFLHNLIADLTGGLTLTVLDDTPAAGARAPHTTTTGGAAPITARRPPAPETAARPAPQTSARPAPTPTPPVRPLGRDDVTERQPAARPAAEAGTRDRRTTDEDLFGRS